VVADTGEVAAIKAFKPIDCTTNPSLVLGALKDPASENLINREIEAGRKHGKSAEELTATLTVAVGTEISRLVPGRISTEVDASLSFDTAVSIRRARQIIADYESRGVGKERVLIKLAATWEGIRAAEILQNEGIDCNLTLIFSLAQAIACAEAGAFLISPFVGRITDWYKKAEGRDGYEPEEDPGVRSVHQIYRYYKSNGITTIVMGASFRTCGQIKALAGCDRLTISPKLLEQLGQEDGELVRALSADSVERVDPIVMDEVAFRWALNSDAMATEKLAEGIRNFDADHRTLISLIGDRMKSSKTAKSGKLVESSK
jgi:transaldolase